MEKMQKALAVSIRGASHYKDDKPMQDYSASVFGDDFAVAVVCDGHGADKHFRSEVGSRLATETTLSKLQDFYSLNSTYELLQIDAARKLDRLKLAIIAEWQNKVDAYTRDNPFTEAELAKASKTLAVKMHYDVAQPYGTTVLAALVCKDYYLALMIGDGAIIKITDKFAAETVMFEGKHVYDDAPHSATDSLCGGDAYKTFFATYGKVEASQPLAMALCSDGLTESLFFPKEADLLNKANNYLNYYAEEGLDKALVGIEAQLNEISKGAYPWDDISIAYCTLTLSAFDKRTWPAEPVAEQPEHNTDGADKQAETQTAEQPATEEQSATEEKQAEADKQQPPQEVAEVKDEALSEEDFAQDPVDVQSNDDSGVTVSNQTDKA